MTITKLWDLKDADEVFKNIKEQISKDGWMLSKTDENEAEIRKKVGFMKFQEGNISFNRYNEALSLRISKKPFEEFWKEFCEKSDKEWEVTLVEE